MAKRPIFITEKVGPILIREQEVEFVFSNGFSLSQKQKSIESLHDEAYDLLQLEVKFLRSQQNQFNLLEHNSALLIFQ